MSKPSTPFASAPSRSAGSSCARVSAPVSRPPRPATRVSCVDATSERRFSAVVAEVGRSTNAAGGARALRADELDVEEVFVPEVETAADGSSFRGAAGVSRAIGSGSWSPFDALPQVPRASLAGPSRVAEAPPDAVPRASLVSASHDELETLPPLADGDRRERGLRLASAGPIADVSPGASTGTTALTLPRHSLLEAPSRDRPEPSPKPSRSSKREILMGLAIGLTSSLVLGTLGHLYLEKREPPSGAVPPPPAGATASGHAPPTPLVDSADARSRALGGEVPSKRSAAPTAASPEDAPSRPRTTSAGADAPPARAPEAGKAVQAPSAVVSNSTTSGPKRATTSGPKRAAAVPTQRQRVVRRSSPAPAPRPPEPSGVRSGPEGSAAAPRPSSTPAAAADVPPSLRAGLGTELPF